MTPRDLVLALLGRGPANRHALVGYLMGRGVPYVDAERQVGQALLELHRVGRIESFGGMDVWRLTQTAAPMEEA